MRKLMWFTVGFAAACALSTYLLPDWWMLILALFCLVAGIGLYFLKHKFALVASVILFGCAVGSAWNWGYQLLYLQTAQELDGKTVNMHMEATDYSFQTGYNTAVDGTLELDGKQYCVRLYVPSQEQYAPGDKIWGQAQLRYTVRDGEREATYHRGDGLFLLAYATGQMYAYPAGEVPISYFPALLRQRLSNVIFEAFPEDTAAFAVALLLGDDSRLTFAEDAAFQLSGIRHVIAVSGLHVSILFAVIYVVTGKKRTLSVLIGLPVLFLFAAMAGFTPSVVRACVMQALMILAMLLNKEYDPPTALAASAMVMLVVNPLTIASVSFQLSTGCMIGIILFSEPIRKYLLHEKRLGTGKGKTLRAGLTRWLAGSISVSLGAMSVTLPLCAWYFGIVSIVGILTNLLTLWVISTIFYGIMLVCILSWIWMPFAGVIAWLISWPIRYVLVVADLLSRIPLGAVFTDSIYIVLWIAASYILLVIFLLCKKKHPLIFSGCIAGLLCVSVAVSWIEPKMDNYRMTVIDVGQGQCILLQSKEDTYLVDCGGTNPERTAMTVLRHLYAQGIFKLDGIILTHYDKDHAGAVPHLMERMEVEALYVPNADPENSLRQAIVNPFRNRTRFVLSEKHLEVGCGTVTIFPAEAGETGNESSMCILFQTKNCDILITGDRNIDGEMYLLTQTELPDLEVLVAGHHGAASSSGLPFLLETMPDVVIVSVGEGNPYNHPEEQALRRFEMIGCTVYRTDIQGTIVIRG